MIGSGKLFLIRLLRDKHAEVLAFILIIIFLGAFRLHACESAQCLFIELKPEQQMLQGTAHIHVESLPSDLLLFHLSKKSTIRGIFVNGKKAQFRFSESTLFVPVNADIGRPVDIRIEYSAVFADPVPHLPANTDNPGFGVEGVISEKGCFLLGGSGWRPVMPGDKKPLSLTVKAPEGMIAVTSGKRAGEKTEGGNTYSRWEIGRAGKGLSLSAGYFDVFRKQAHNVPVLAYFYPDTRHLADDYLTAASAYIADYASMFGPYPFSKFAIVENFFPTGYGFASYTLIGSRVLRLPFIIDTSLGHEIAHCWWGNGVYPDYSKGNWSEGLTTYVAEHRFKERDSLQKARDYRFQILRNYATLIDASNDFPLARFTARIDQATKVIGYDKGTMFFHMLRKEVGDDIFWKGLAEMFTRHLFKPASWKDFREIYESLSGKPLKMFFDQWINRKGAPQIALENVETFEDINGKRVVKGMLVQKPPFFHLNVAVALETDQERMAKMVPLRKKMSPFEFILEKGVPVKLSVDPDADIFRKLHDSQIPPTINSLKASRSLLVVMAEGADFLSKQIAELLINSLGVTNYRIVFERDLHKMEMESHDLLWLGLPSSKDLLPFLPENIFFRKEAFVLNGTEYFPEKNTLFGVFEHPAAGHRVMGLFLPCCAENLETSARKITHYGKYSYLVFERGQATEKGIWPSKQSPLVFRF